MWKLLNFVNHQVAQLRWLCTEVCGVSNNEGTSRFTNEFHRTIHKNEFSRHSGGEVNHLTFNKIAIYLCICEENLPRSTQWKPLCLCPCVRQCRLLLLARSPAKYWPPLVENRPVQTEREETIFRGQREKEREREHDEPRSPQAFAGWRDPHPSRCPSSPGKREHGQNIRERDRTSFTVPQEDRGWGIINAELRWRRWRKESCYYGMSYSNPQSTYTWFPKVIICYSIICRTIFWCSTLYLN